MAAKSAYLKYSVLLLITIQTSALVLLLRYSRKGSEASEKYFNSTAVFLTEVIKIVICIAVIRSGNSSIGLLRILRNEIFGNVKESVKILVPAFLYTIQNNLLYLALTNLDAATYQVTYQFKILTTALFAVTILHRRLSYRQWLSLLILMTGVILVQWRKNEKANPSEDKLIGLIAVFLSSLSSGFSGVYFEKLIKFNTQSLWTRNVQLAAASMVFSACTILAYDYDNIAKKGFFFGYNSITWVVIFLQAAGGICVSLVMKYADNILKGFATTFSIIISLLCSYYLFDDFVPTVHFYIGTCFVVISSLLYSL